MEVANIMTVAGNAVTPYMDSFHINHAATISYANLLPVAAVDSQILFKNAGATSLEVVFKVTSTLGRVQ